LSTPRAGTVDISLLLLIFLLPSSFQLTPPAIPIGNFYITLVEICLFILLGHWLLDLLVSGTGYVSPLDKVFSLFLAYLCLSLIFGSQHFGVNKALGDFRQYLPLFLYFWVMRFFGFAKDLSRVRQGILNVTIVVAIYVVFIFLFFRGAIATRESLAERVFFDNTMLPLMIYGGYVLGIALMKNEKSHKGFASILLASNFIMLIVMQVRTYWIAFAIVIAMATFNQRRAFFKTAIMVKNAYWVSLILAVTFLFLTFVPAETIGLQEAMTSVKERIESLISFEQTFLGQENTWVTETETVGTRLATAKVVWNEYVMNSPLFGTGLGGEIPIMSRLGGVVLMKYSIDNGYLTILAKFGVIGFALYGLIIWRLCQMLYRIIVSPFSHDDEKLLAYSFLAGVAAMLVASFFSSNFIRQQPALVAFLFMLAETSVLQRTVETRRRESQIQGVPLPRITIGRM